MPLPPAIFVRYQTELNASVFDCTFVNLKRGDTQYILEWKVGDTSVRKTTLNSTSEMDILTQEEFLQANGSFGSQVSEETIFVLYLISLGFFFFTFSYTL